LKTPKTSKSLLPLIESIPKLAGRQVLVVGDVGIDEYVMGEVRRISPEAPVPVLEVEKSEHRLGLAGNVAQNLTALGAQPHLVSIVGKDASAEHLISLCHQQGVSTEHLLQDPDRPTTSKVRIMAKHHHLVRVDYEKRKYLSADLGIKLLKKIENLLPSVEIVIVEDYAKGVFSPIFFKEVVQLAKKANRRVFVDPHRSNPGDFYSGADLLKPNFDEAVALSGLTYDDLRDSADKVVEVGRALQKKVGAHDIVMTRGKDGMTIFSGDSITQVPTYARQVFDVTGAGDTVIATLAAGVAAGLPLERACQLANFAAGVVVGQIGCVPCTAQELLAYIESFSSETTY